MDRCIVGTLVSWVGHQIGGQHIAVWRVGQPEDTLLCTRGALFCLEDLHLEQLEPSWK